LRVISEKADGREQKVERKSEGWEQRAKTIDLFLPKLSRNFEV